MFNNLFAPPSGLLAADQEEQLRQQMQTQGLLGLAAGLFQAGTPSHTPVSVGGSALQGLMAGQQMASETMNQAIRGQLLRQQMADAQEKRTREQQLKEAISGSMRPTLTGRDVMAAQSNIDPALLEGMSAQQVVGQAIPTGPRQIDRDAALQALAQYGGIEGLGAYITATKPSEKETFKLLSPSEAKTLGLPVDMAFQMSSTGKISQVGTGPLVKNIVGGQSGLDNEMKIRGAFKDEPVYKAYNEMQTAYNQISESLKQASPAGDLAGATKFMKLLDPGSVVRESELFMAMQASGALDRFTNYANNVIKGTKLTPTQRLDFQNLADKLYAASVQAYNKKRGEYATFAQEYGLNPDRATGPSATFSKNIKVDY